MIRRHWMEITVIAAILPFLACAVLFSDNGVALADAIREGADRLRTSERTEELVLFKRLPGSSGPFDVQAGAWSKDTPNPYLSVSGARGGGTTSHLRYVEVPNALSIHKEGGSVTVVLRKRGNAIELAEFR